MIVFQSGNPNRVQNLILNIRNNGVSYSNKMCAVVHTVCIMYSMLTFLYSNTNSFESMCEYQCIEIYGITFSSMLRVELSVHVAFGTTKTASGSAKSDRTETLNRT